MKVYPPLISNPHFRPIIYNLNTISILDGGTFFYYGYAEADDELTVTLAGDLMIRGGGAMYVNKMKLSGTSYFCIKFIGTFDCAPINLFIKKIL